MWLTVMSLFPLSLLLLKFNRGRLPRQSHTPLWIILLALAVAATVIAGNVSIEPSTAGYVHGLVVELVLTHLGCRYFAAYFLGIVLIFSATQNKVHLLRWVYWAYDQYPVLHRWGYTRSWGTRLIDLMTHLKRQPVCILVKSDEVRCQGVICSCMANRLQINHLFHMILYVRKNEETSFLKIVHFNEHEKGIPSELEANAKSLYRIYIS